MSSARLSPSLKTQSQQTRSLLIKAHLKDKTRSQQTAIKSLHRKTHRKTHLRKTATTVSLLQAASRGSYEGQQVTVLPQAWQEEGCWHFLL